MDQLTQVPMDAKPKPIPPIVTQTHPGPTEVGQVSLEKHAAEFDRHNFVQRIANDKLIAKGILHFEAFYDENYGLTILRSKNIPELNNRVDSTRVTDSLMSDTYELKIELKDASVLPQVFEIGIA